MSSSSTHIWGDGLQNFIRDHQDQLERMEGQLRDLTTMMNQAVKRLMIHMESYRQDLHRVEGINAELLRWVLALEHGWGNPIVIPDSPEPVPVPPPRILGPGSVLVEINNGVNDEQNQAVAEDQVEEVVRWRVTIEEGGVFGIAREEYEDGEDIMDVLRRVEAQDNEIPRYPPVPGYDDPYIPDVQQ